MIFTFCLPLADINIIVDVGAELTFGPQAGSNSIPVRLDELVEDVVRSLH